MNKQQSIYSYVLEEMGMPIELLIFEGIAALITLTALILLIIASIKIFKAGNIPGSRLILGSLIGSVVVSIISISFEMLSHEENNIITGTFEILVALLFFLGVFGFFSLSKYLHEKNANKRLWCQPPD